MGAPRDAGPMGRAMRAFVGACVAWITVPVYFDAPVSYNLRSLGLFAALVLFYTLLHGLASRYFPRLPPGIGALLAVVPTFLVWFLGQGGGPLFGQGEGGTAALSYIWISLLIDAARADSGCEVMAIPGLLFRDRTHLACVLFSPIDMLEKR